MFLCFFYRAKDPTQGLWWLGKNSTTEQHPQPFETGLTMGPRLALSSGSSYLTVPVLGL
jgi:uncharacterized membrane protein YfbV (UPF0208 family)